jgi:hypothetical protein
VKSSQKNEKKKVLKLRNCHIVTQSDYVTEEQIKKVLADNKNILKYVYILHDKDLYSPQDLEGNKIPKGFRVGDLKIPHYHIYLQLNNAYTPSLIASWFDIPANLVEKIKVSTQHTLCYMTHLNIKDHTYQFLYDDSEMKSNFDWKSLRDIKRIWRRKEIERFCLRITEPQPGDLKIKRFNTVNYIDLFNYDKYKSLILNAHSYREQKILVNPDLKLDINIVYIYGKSGFGKTKLARKMIKEKGFGNSFYEANGSGDIFGNYGGQEAVLIDDYRPKDSVLKLSDILTIFDNSGSYKTVKSRYYNKLLEANWIFITTVLNIEEFFSQLVSKFEELGAYEDSLQLRRRIKYCIKVEKDKIFYRKWLHNKKNFSECFFKPNNIMEENNFFSVDPSEENILEDMKNDFKDQNIRCDDQSDVLIGLAKEFFGSEKVTVLNGNISDNDF